jgi:UDP-N-acetylglucosamine 2-epimerase (non-hydrolysing)
MIEFEKILLKEKPDIVVVAGDVNSTMACAITAVKLGIKVAHIESGLRSRDKSMPEEINRIITDSISDFLFVSEKSGLDNLIKEGVDSSNIYFVGNIMIDSLAFLKKKIIESDILKSLGIKKKEYILVTFHRPSNVDSKQSLKELIDFLNNLSLKTRIVFPVHPRTLHNIRKFDLENSIYGNVIITPPLGYIEFQNLIMNASAVVTDSGGVQEETTYLGVPCLTVRDNTERPITIEVGTNQLCGTDLKTVTEKAREILAGKIKKGTIPELWDGRTADRIVDVLINELK